MESRGKEVMSVIQSRVNGRKTLRMNAILFYFLESLGTSSHNSTIHERININGVLRSFKILYIYILGGTFNIIPLSTRGILFPHGEMQRDKMYRLL